MVLYWCCAIGQFCETILSAYTGPLLSGTSLILVVVAIVVAAILVALITGLLCWRRYRKYTGRYKPSEIEEKSLSTASDSEQFRPADTPYNVWTTPDNDDDLLM